MRILILGADGYLGWPTCLHFASKGHDILAIDSGVKRRWETKCKVKPLFPVDFFLKGAEAWNRSGEGSFIETRVLDTCDANSLYRALEKFIPEVIIHYAEQPSAPYSMMMRRTAVETQFNNVVGTLNLLFGMAHACPEAHLIKLGSMGEYGTPNIDIQEGWIEVVDNPSDMFGGSCDRRDILPFPKQPGSFYHLSKVHDSHNIMFACRTWNLRATDLNQGVVYGISTNSNSHDVSLGTSFHYDHIFGTVLNRFIVQATLGMPLTVYGSGKQTRGFLNIKDTMQCVELAALNPPETGEYRVFNQFTELFSIQELAEKVAKLTGVDIYHPENPRIESEDHYYNPIHTKLEDLGLKPTLLTDDVLEGMLDYARRAKNVNRWVIDPKVLWKGGSHR